MFGPAYVNFILQVYWEEFQRRGRWRHMILLWNQA